MVLFEEEVMKLNSLHDLLVMELRDLYYAEKQIIKSLPKMSKAANSEELKAAFEEHLEQTEHHVERLEQIFEKLGERSKAKTCEALDGLVEETKDFISEDAEGSVMDAGLIACAQKVEHYEIASYGTCRTWARQLGRHDVAELLQQTLDEESQTDEKLTRLADHMVNPQAAHA